MNNEPKKLNIAISSRALFDLEEGHQVYLEQGVEAYQNYQIEREHEILKPGIAFNMIKKLLALNLLNKKNNALPKVEVVLLSRNNSDTGLRIFNSIKHYELDIFRAVFSSGESPLQYVQAFESNLFLSADANDVNAALQQGIAAATLLSKGTTHAAHSEQLRLAFDGDAVLFSDDSEKIYKQHGLEKFDEHEQKVANQPLSPGPFKEFLQMVHHFQQAYSQDDAPIRTTLVTSRGAPAHERVIKTFRAWGIRIDETFFLGGKEKGVFLKAFGADIFFDDQTRHCLSAGEYVSAAHVPYGIANQPEKKSK